MKKSYHQLIVMFAVLLFASTAAHAYDYANSFTGSNDYLYMEEPKKISMDFKNAQLNDVLKIFSQQSGLNFIASTEISSKTINLYLDNVPVEEALERILSANNLTYELNKSGNIFVVKEKKEPEDQLVTRIYELKHATVPSSKLLSTFGSSSSESSSTSVAGESGASGGAGILSILTSLVGVEGSVIEEPRTNSLIVRTHPSNIPAIESALQRIDVRIPQILIEVEMLDISKNTSDKLGVLFSEQPFQYTGPSKDTYLPFDQNKLLSSGKADPIEYTAGTIDFSSLSITLNFLRNQGDTKSLARPRILTLNNETAEIKIETDEAIGTSTTSTSDTGSTTAEAERAETGVTLRVTPQANVETGEITMAVEPRVADARSGIVVNGQLFKDPETRSSQSILRVQNGDTVIMGGLLRTDSVDTRVKVPFLGDIPVVGQAFRHKDASSDERELVIFLTPHIIEDTLAARKANPMRPSSNIVREQEIPSKRMNEISKELSLLEKRKF